MDALKVYVPLEPPKPSPFGPVGQSVGKSGTYLSPRRHPSHPNHRPNHCSRRRGTNGCRQTRPGSKSLSALAWGAHDFSHLVDDAEEEVRITRL